MAVTPRTVKNRRDENGMLTGKSGTVYDVNIKYKSPEGKKVYSKKGFPTKKIALQYEAEMKTKLAKGSYTPIVAAGSKQSVKEYFENWVEVYGKVNLRPSTYTGYKRNIIKHIVPNIGHWQLREVTPDILDSLYKRLFESGLSNNSVIYVHHTISIALEHARKYRYIENNPARDTITKFRDSSEVNVPDPYTIEQMQILMSRVTGTRWEMPVVLGGMYGLRENEVLGLRIPNISLEYDMFSITEQLPFGLPYDTKIVEKLAPPKTKSSVRTLPITDVTRPYFARQIELIESQKTDADEKGEPYYDNQLLVAKPTGEPLNRNQFAAQWGKLLRRLGMPHLRFHDLRVTTATNSHMLSGDFFTVGGILGHSLKGLGKTLGIEGNLDAVTARYVKVKLERKSEVLSAYHNALHEKNPKTNKSAKKGDPEL